jgi:alpha-L-arabinofuranosidase
VINSLIRNADRVKIACLAQLVNVIAPIMTNPDGMFRQTIYYPYSWALQYAKGSVLNLLVETAGYAVPGFDNVPSVDVAGTLDESGGRLRTASRYLSVWLRRAFPVPAARRSQSAFELPARSYAVIQWSLA